MTEFPSFHYNTQGSRDIEQKFKIHIDEKNENGTTTGNIWSFTTEAGSGENYAKIPYETGFENGSLDSYWSIKGSTDFSRIQVTPDYQPHAGNYHLTMDVSSNGAYSQNEAWLHLNLSESTTINLSFWWKDFGDETNVQDGIYFSDNGGISFKKVHDLNGGSTSNQDGGWFDNR